MPRNPRRTSTLAAAPPPTGKNRRISRREREQRQRRYLTIGAIAVTVIVALIAIISTLSFYVVTPNETLATVNGHNISRSDYWKVRRNALLDRLQQYSFQSQLGGAQSNQLQAGADAARMEIKDIRTYAVDPTTLNDMEQDQVVLGALPGIGVTLTDKDVDETVAERFAPVALQTPTPAPTLNPTKQATADAATAIVTQTSVALNGQSTSTAVAVAAQSATTSALTPSTGPPAATVAPTTTAVPTQTPTNMDARATSTATLKTFIDERQKDASISLDDYKRLIIRPNLARQRAREALEANAPTHGEQVHALHILLPTQDAANEARRRIVDQGQDFAAVASELSTDTTTKPNGGDLGYAPRGFFVKPFEDAAFSLPVNAVSAPVQTEFGWHLIKVVDHPQDREYDDSVFRQVRDKQFQTWLDDQTKKAQIKATVPTPIPSPQSAFQPPADAPATPTFTPAPSPAANGTPDPNAATGANGTPGSIGTPAILTTPPAGANGAGGIAPTVMGGSGATGSPAASGGASSTGSTGSTTGNTASTASSSGASSNTTAGSTPSAGAATGPTAIPFTPPSPSAASGGVAPAAAPTSAPTSAPAVMPAAAPTMASAPTVAPVSGGNAAPTAASGLSMPTAAP